MAAEGKTLRANAWRIDPSNDFTLIIHSFCFDTFLYHLKNSQDCLKPKDKEQEQRNLTLKQYRHRTFYKNNDPAPRKFRQWQKQRKGKTFFFFFFLIMFEYRTNLRWKSSSSSAGQIPPDTSTNALSCSGINLILELPWQGFTPSLSHSCLTFSLRCAGQQTRNKISRDLRCCACLK